MIIVNTVEIRGEIWTLIRGRSWIEGNYCSIWACETVMMVKRVQHRSCGMLSLNDWKLDLSKLWKKGEFWLILDYKCIFTLWESVKNTMIPGKTFIQTKQGRNGGIILREDSDDLLRKLLGMIWTAITFML